MTRPIRWFLALAAPLLLASCIVTPAKFTSTLDVRADRSFTFTYVGEVQLMKTKSQPDMTQTSSEGDEKIWQENGERDPLLWKIAAETDAKDSAAPPRKGAEEDFGDSPEEAAKLKALAQALSGEYGYRSVRYIGNRKLAIDYAISGKLDHAFVFPFNPDGDVVLPFIAIELRGKDRVRIKAPGYSNEQNLSAALGGMGGGMGTETDAASALDGTFTLTTNASVISQNQEEGVQTLPDGTKKIAWRATPQTKDAPMAVLKVDPLP